MSSIPPPVLPPSRDYCLFLDFDGTLVDIAPTPGEVRADSALVALLSRSSLLLDGAVGIVSGRPLADVDRLLAPLRIATAGIHGYERRAPDGNVYRPSAGNPSLHALRGELLKFVSQRPGLLLEDKSAALAVHFRLAGHLESVVRDHLLRLVAGLGAELELLEGDSVIEIKPSTHDKATAVEAFMQEAPFSGRVPIYIGDDHTDRDGFEAVTRHGGMAIGVGNRVSTPWRLRDPSAVRAWLTDFNSMSVQGVLRPAVTS